MTEHPPGTPDGDKPSPEEPSPEEPHTAADGHGPPPPGPQPPGLLPPGYAYPPPGYGAPQPGYGGAFWGPDGFHAPTPDPLISTDMSGWWQRSFTLLRAAWLPIVLIQLISILFTTGLWITVELVFGGRTRWTTDVPGARDPIDWESLGRSLLLVLPCLLIVALLSLVTGLASSQVLIQVATGRPVSILAALGTGLRRLLPLIGWSALGTPLILLGFVFCLLPGVYVFAVLAVLQFVVLLERGKGIGRCFELFHTNLGVSVTRLATIGGLGIGLALAHSAFATVLSVPISPLAAVDADDVAAGIVGTVISAVFSIAGALLATPMLLTAYADMRARREPFSTAYLQSS